MKQERLKSDTHSALSQRMSFENISQCSNSWQQQLWVTRRGAGRAEGPTESLLSISSHLAFLCATLFPFCSVILSRHQLCTYPFLCKPVSSWAQEFSFISLRILTSCPNAHKKFLVQIFRWQGKKNPAPGGRPVGCILRGLGWEGI